VDIAIHHVYTLSQAVVYDYDGTFFLLFSCTLLRLLLEPPSWTAGEEIEHI